jgi:hypothetical protein
LLRLVGADGSLLFLLGLELFHENRKLHVLVHLGLGTLDVLLIARHHSQKDLVSFFLAIQGFSVIIKLKVSVSNSLVAASNLDMVLSKEINISVQTL